MPSAHILQLSFPTEWKTGGQRSQFSYKESIELDLILDAFPNLILWYFWSDSMILELIQNMVYEEQ